MNLNRNANDKELKTYGFNKLSSTKDKVLIGEPVSIIQHPQGAPKMIAIRENKIVDIQSPFIHYTTDTQQGSSGSLVVNDQWEVVALHRSSIPKTDTNGKILLHKGGIREKESDDPFIIWIANQGVLIDAILQDVQEQNCPPVMEAHKKEILKYFQRENHEYRLPDA